MPTQHFSSAKRLNWQTPEHILAAARCALGGDFDLDPASSAEANDRVRAARYLTPTEDGLTQPWNADRLWLNPPYGRETPRWVGRLVGEYELGQVTAAITIVTSAVETRWFEPLWRFPICFPRGRVAFIDAETGRPAGGNTKGSAIVGLGVDFARFRSAFELLGHMVLPR